MLFASIKFVVLPHLAPLLLLLLRLLLLRSFLLSQPFPLYFTRAFFYPHSSQLVLVTFDHFVFQSFQNNRCFSCSIDGLRNRHNVAIVLATGDRRLAFSSSELEIVCGTFNGLQRWNSLTSAKLEPLHIGYAHAPCRLAIYRIVCHPFPFKNLSPRIGLKIDQSDPIKIKVTFADQTLRQIVVCPGRVFLFEQWHLLLTSLELHRLHRVDLVLVHVLSVHPSVFSLLRLYEKEGFVWVRPSLQLPSAESGNSPTFDANSETLWNNQLVNFHDCLYTFKESSAFIAFPDWDDLLLTPSPSAFLSSTSFPSSVPSSSATTFPASTFSSTSSSSSASSFASFPSSVPSSPATTSPASSASSSSSPSSSSSASVLSAALLRFVSVHPFSAALLPKRFPGHFPTITQFVDNGWEIFDLFEKGVRFSVWPSDAQFISKVLLRPKFVSGVDLHGPAGSMALAHQIDELPAENAFFVHARDYQKNPRLNQRLPFASLLVSNLATFLHRHNASLSDLPKSERFVPTLNECLRNIEAKVRRNRHSKCFNYAQCRKELLENVEGNGGKAWECVGTDNRWSAVQRTRHFRFYVMEDEAMAQFSGIRCLP
ncbi:hypothetical protein niasHT_014257 [Heterodera trifolii]|uniref:Glycosyltransferase family 92 protein n=1 Tax=Heterodera trifolii TaxID=157864 RepID=A0ABD2LK22_9BILA